MTGFAIGGGVAILALVALAIALIDNARKGDQIAALQVAIEKARADGETNRADVAERQVTAAMAAKKEAEDDADQQLETALKTGGVVDPTSTWDARSDASGPVGVLPSSAAGASPRVVPATVPDRGHGGDIGGTVAGSDRVPGRGS